MRDHLERESQLVQVCVCSSRGLLDMRRTVGAHRVVVDLRRLAATALIKIWCRRRSRLASPAFRLVEDCSAGRGEASLAPMKRIMGLGLLVLLGFGGLIMGALIFAGADNAVHEIEGLICILIGTVGIGFSTSVAATEAARDEIEVQTRTATGTRAQPASSPAPR